MLSVLQLVYLHTKITHTNYAYYNIRDTNSISILSILKLVYLCPHAY